ncbi:hypothetical protein V8E36_007200 [Tilletia maclaganii]
MTSLMSSGPRQVSKVCTWPFRSAVSCLSGPHALRPRDSGPHSTTTAAGRHAGRPRIHARTQAQARQGPGCGRVPGYFKSHSSKAARRASCRTYLSNPQHHQERQEGPFVPRTSPMPNHIILLDHDLASILVERARDRANELSRMEFFERVQAAMFAGIRPLGVQTFRAHARLTLSHSVLVDGHTALTGQRTEAFKRLNSSRPFPVSALPLPFPSSLSHFFPSLSLTPPSLPFPSRTRLQDIGFKTWTGQQGPGLGPKVGVGSRPSTSDERVGDGDRLFLQRSAKLFQVVRAADTATRPVRRKEVRIPQPDPLEEQGSSPPAPILCDPVKKPDPRGDCRRRHVSGDEPRVGRLRLGGILVPRPSSLVPRPSSLVPGPCPARHLLDYPVHRALVPFIHHRNSMLSLSPSLPLLASEPSSTLHGVGAVESAIHEPRARSGPQHASQRDRASLAAVQHNAHRTHDVVELSTPYSTQPDEALA